MSLSWLTTIIKINRISCFSSLSSIDSSLENQPTKSMFDRKETESLLKLRGCILLFLLCLFANTAHFLSHTAVVTSSHHSIDFSLIDEESTLLESSESCDQQNLASSEQICLACQSFQYNSSELDCQVVVIEPEVLLSPIPKIALPSLTSQFRDCYGERAPPAIKL